MCRKSGKNISINRSIDYCALSPFLSGRQTVRSLETESDVADFGLIREKVKVEGITDSPFIFGLRIFPVCPGADEYAVGSLLFRKIVFISQTETTS